MANSVHGRRTGDPAPAVTCRFRRMRAAKAVSLRHHSFNMSSPKQVVVVGAGIAGLFTAYYLARAGHDVAVLERHGNVAEEASFGNGGLLGPGCPMPPVAPPPRNRVLAAMFRQEGSVVLGPQVDRALWRWIRAWQDECTDPRFAENALRMQRLAAYGKPLLAALRESVDPEPDYERGRGSMRLYRTEAGVEAARASAERCAEIGIACRVLDAGEARALEPALPAHAPLAGALHFPGDESGNCPLFARQLRHLAQDAGVQFHFSTAVEAIQPTGGGGIGFRAAGQTIHVDALVLAAGAGSLALLRPLGIELPVRAVRAYAATATITDFDAAPHRSIVDVDAHLSIVRIGSRIRVAGVLEAGARGAEIPPKAIAALVDAGVTWFPAAANFNKAIFWGGNLPLTPTGAPLLGAAPAPGLFLNLGHGATGWGTAAGAGKAVADIVSGEAPGTDLAGLTLQEHG